MLCPGGLGRVGKPVLRWVTFFRNIACQAQQAQQAQQAHVTGLGEDAIPPALGKIAERVLIPARTDPFDDCGRELNLFSLYLNI